MPISAEILDSRFRFAFDRTQSDAASKRYNEVLDETKNFLAIPSLGSIVKNWILIVPKWPVANFAQVPSALQPELAAFISRIAGNLGNASGRTYLFEHGATYDSDLSCGVHQAHLHLVNLNFDLTKASEQALPGKWKEVTSQFPRFGTRGPYFFVSDLANTSFIACDIPITSQWFRKIIAQQSSNHEEWDYRRFAHMSNVEETINTFRKGGKVNAG